jgi:hypothetical protein
MVDSIGPGGAISLGRVREGDGHGWRANAVCALDNDLPVLALCRACGGGNNWDMVALRLSAASVSAFRARHAFDVLRPPGLRANQGASLAVRVPCLLSFAIAKMAVAYNFVQLTGRGCQYGVFTVAGPGCGDCWLGSGDLVFCTSQVCTDNGQQCAKFVTVTVNRGCCTLSGQFGVCVSPCQSSCPG